MTAKTITFGISKGGCSKTTSAAITAHLLSQEAKVLCVDMDSQGNLTSFLTGENDICTVFDEKTVLEGIKNQDVTPYIVKVKENLDIVPSNDYLSLLPRFLYSDYKGNRNLALRKALEPVMDNYDYIIIDTPPSLSENTITSLSASDYAVVMFDGSLFCYHAISKFIELCIAAKENGNPNLDVAGILLAIVDPRTNDSKAMTELIENEYKDIRFETIITRRAATKRLPIFGFENNKEAKNAVKDYELFVKELKSRVNK